MIGWFANAIEAGRDAGRREYFTELGSVADDPRAVKILKAPSHWTPELFFLALAALYLIFQAQTLLPLGAP